MLAVGDEVTAKVLKFDQEKNRVSLGMKQLGEDPWVGLSRRYPTGTRLFGKVTNITDYGAFVEIEPGIEGLVHVSEMDWTNKNIHPTKVVQLGDEVEVMILEIDEERRRISLGMKQCMPNPWDDFAMNHKKGDKVNGPDQVDHRLRRVRRPARRHRRPGAPVRSVVDAAGRSRGARLQEGRRKSKRWCSRSTSSASASRSASSSSTAIRSPTSSPRTTRARVVTGTVKSLDAKGAVIALDGEVEGYLRASEVARDRVEDMRTHLKEGDTVKAMIINIDRKNRSINLSIKAKDHADESEAMQRISADNSGHQRRHDQPGRAAQGQAGQQEPTSKRAA